MFEGVCGGERTGRAVEASPLYFLIRIPLSLSLSLSLSLQPFAIVSLHCTLSHARLGEDTALLTQQMATLG